MNSSGQLRSRCISPTSPLTDRKITAYILAGRYGEQAKQIELKKQKSNSVGKPKQPRTMSLHPNSLAVKSLSHLL